MFISTVSGLQIVPASCSSSTEMHRGSLTNPIQGTINVVLGVLETPDSEQAQYNLELPFAMDDSIERSRKALVDAGYNVLQLGHRRLLACQPNGNKPSRTIDLIFHRIDLHSTEIVCITKP